MSRAASNLKFPEEKKMESENFQGSGPLLDPRGLAVFIAPLSYGSYGSLSRRLRPGTGLLLFVVRFVRSITSVVNFFVPTLI